MQAVISSATAIKLLEVKNTIFKTKKVPVFYFEPKYFDKNRHLTDKRK